MAKQIGAVQFTGKFADVVGAKGYGKKILRAKAESVSNPRTDAQCIQRMICATAGVAVSYLKEILNNSVEGKPSGVQTLNYLRSQWMRMLRTADMLSPENKLQYLPKGVKSFTINPYLLSVGTLQAPAYTIDAYNAYLHIPSMGTPSASIRPSELFPNIAVGDQITIIAGYLNDEIGSTYVAYCRFAFKTDAAPALISTTGGFTINPNAIDLNKAAGDWNKLLFKDTKDIDLISITDGYDVYAGGLIVSNIENKKRSTSFMAVDSNYSPGNFSAELAYPTYAQEAMPIDMVSPIYLNNSARRVAAQGDVHQLPEGVTRMIVYNSGDGPEEGNPVDYYTDQYVTDSDGCAIRAYGEDLSISDWEVKADGTTVSVSLQDGVVVSNGIDGPATVQVFYKNSLIWEFTCLLGPDA